MAIRSRISNRRKRRKAVRSHRRRRRQPTTHRGRHQEGRSRKAKPARALPKLPSREARIRRVAVWKKFRPVTRWHRRTPVAVVLAFYFGVAGALSLAVCFWLLQTGAPALQPPAIPVPASDEPGALGLGVAAKTGLLQEALAPDDFSALELQAEEALRKGDFSGAEVLYRKILPHSRFMALTGFHLFLCLLQQGKFEEAELLASKVPQDSVSRNPVRFYVSAAYAIKSGHLTAASESISSAHSLFPDISVFYDKALREAGMELH